MIFARLGIGLLLAVPLFVVPGSALASTPPASNPAPAPDHAVIPLYAAGPRALVMLTLGEGPPAPVVFDTGEDKAFLVSSYAKQLKLMVIGTSPLVDEATGTRSIVPVVRLASPRLSDVPLMLTEARMVDYHEQDMVGVFGPGAFRGRLVTLELALNRVRISPLSPETVPPGEATPYFHDLPALTIDVAGLPVTAHLDSGANWGLSLGSTLMNKVKLKSKPVVIGQATSVSGTQDIYGGQIDGDVKIGPLVLHDPEVSFGGPGGGANVGYELMRNLILVMDPAGQRGWVLDPADMRGPIDQFAGQFGVRLVTTEGAKLLYQREGRPQFELKYLGGDLFDMPATGDRVQFHRKDGKVTGLDLITSNGDVVSASRGQGRSKRKPGEE